MNIGVVGAGNMGADHVRTLQRDVRGAAVSMVADPDLGRAASAGARASDDAFALIADADVEAVVIASPDSTHAELVLAALRAGKPVLCEKPLAPTAADCRRLAETDTESLLSVGFMRRFDPAYRDLKAALQAGECGRPLLLHCAHRGVSSGPGTTDESTIRNSDIHEFDVVPWLLGSPIVEVSWHAPGASAVDGFQDPHLVHLRTADGALATVEGFRNARYGYDIRCEVVGDRATRALPPSPNAADWRTRFADAYRLELQAWVDALAAGRPSAVPTARDAVAAATVAEAVVASMRQGSRAVAVA